MYYLYRLAVLMKSSLQHCTHVSSQSHKSSSPFLFFLTQLIAIKRVCSLFYTTYFYILWIGRAFKKRIWNPTQIICVLMHASFLALHIPDRTKRYLKIQCSARTIYSNNTWTENTCPLYWKVFFETFTRTRFIWPSSVRLDQ